MKANFILSLIIISVLVLPSGMVLADELSFSNVGLLPSNPFYFLKEWRRDVKKFFTFNEIRKAVLELEIANEKAIELQKLQEIVSAGNTEAIQKAVSNYKDHLTRLKARLLVLKETSQNPNVDKLLDNLAESGLKHQDLFDGLLEKLGAASDLGVQISQLKQDLFEAVATALTRLDEPRKFRKRFERAILNNAGKFSELRAAEFLENLEEKLSSEMRKKSFQLKDDLLLKFNGRLEGQFLISVSGGQDYGSSLENLPGDIVGRMRILDEARERLTNADIRTQLNHIRQRILEKFNENAGVSSELAKQAANFAALLISQVETEISGAAARFAGEPRPSNDGREAVPALVKQMLDRAKFGLDQVKLLFDAGNFEGALGQAVSVQSIAKGVLLYLSISNGDHAGELEALKNSFDYLANEAKSLDLDKENSPKLFELFGQAEKKIVELAGLVNSKASLEKIVTVTRNAKLLLATIEELLRISAGY